MAQLREALAAKFGGAMQHSLGVGEDDTAAATTGVTPGNARNKFDGTRAARDARLIPVDQIMPDPDQPREEFDEESLKRLSHSLDAQGQLQPIRVRWSENEGKWMIIAGERRWRAAKQSRTIQELACIVVDRAMAAEEVLHEQLVENCPREDLKPIEQAKAFHRVMEARAWSATRMAEELGISAPTVTRALALLRLPEDIQEAVDAGALPPRTAAEIGSLDTPAERRELALEAMSREMTRDQVSEAVRKRKAERGMPRKGRRPSKPGITPGNAAAITPGNAADSICVLIQGPRQARRRGWALPGETPDAAAEGAGRPACGPRPDRTGWLSGQGGDGAGDGETRTERSDLMSTIAPTQPTVTSPPPPPSPPLHRITVDEYERIIAAGALEDPSRVELIDGYMVDKMGKNPGHRYSTKEVLKALESRLPPGWTSQKEEPVRIPAYDEPEPDVAIVRGTDADYRHRLPTAADVGLVVEVSDSTLSQDRGKKRTAYAKGGIPIYWIVNLVDRRVEVYTGPGPAGYQSRVDFKAGQQVPVVIGGQQLRPIAVDDILP